MKISMSKNNNKIINNNNNNKMMMTMATMAAVLATVSNLPMVDSADISEECRTETEPLLTDSSLAIAQSVIFEDYEKAFDDICNFGFDDLGCSIEFEGDERTYKALCEAQGGQLYQRPVVLSCLLGSVEKDLGFIPTCVGGSCNITNVGPGDVVSEPVQAFLDNITITGCKADASDATSLSTMTKSSLAVGVMGSLSAALIVGFGF